MKFIANKPKENVLHLARKLGYRPISSSEGELSCVRPLAGRDYPRFHLFLKEDREKKELSFSLHLDQKKPSYSGSPAHSGEYGGELVERETERIKKIIEGLK